MLAFSWRRPLQASQLSFALPMEEMLLLLWVVPSAPSIKPAMSCQSRQERLNNAPTPAQQAFGGLWVRRELHYEPRAFQAVRFAISRPMCFGAWIESAETISPLVQAFKRLSVPAARPSFPAGFSGCSETIVFSGPNCHKAHRNSKGSQGHSFPAGCAHRLGIKVAVAL